MPGVRNIYFDLTRAFNQHRRNVVLCSGQAVVYYRLAILSKDGDWIIRETDAACSAVLEVLAAHGARYRPGAPLDVRWLAGGWSSHFEFEDEEGLRTRCDFFSRPPRVSSEAADRMFAVEAAAGSLPVIDLESLILVKRTQRAKDYPVISELARLLPPNRELELTTDPDRIIELAARYGAVSERPSVRAVAAGRAAVIRAVAQEIDDFRQSDAGRMRAYATVALPYLRAVNALSDEVRTLPAAHARMVELATSLLPLGPDGADECRT